MRFSEDYTSSFLLCPPAVMNGGERDWREGGKKGGNAESTSVHRASFCDVRHSIVAVCSSSSSSSSSYHSHHAGFLPIVPFSLPLIFAIGKTPSFLFRRLQNFFPLGFLLFTLNRCERKSAIVISQCCFALLEEVPCLKWRRKRPPFGVVVWCCAVASLRTAVRLRR